MSDALSVEPGLLRMFDALSVESRLRDLLVWGVYVLSAAIAL
jgi:hypothetical protein